MARIRTVKPELFKHEALFDAERETGLPLRVAYIGLFTVADREGRFHWRPRALKTDVLPYDEIEFSRVLDALATRGFVCRYASQGAEYGFIPSWHRHQVVNNREAPSELPQPPEIIDEDDASSTREARDTDIDKGKGREGKGTGREGDSEAKASGATTPAEVISLDAKTALFREGLDILSGLVGRPVNSIRSQVGRWVQLTGEDHSAVLALIRRARDQSVVDAMSWIEASLKPKDPDAEIYRGVL